LVSWLTDYDGALQVLQTHLVNIVCHFLTKRHKQQQKYDCGYNNIIFCVANQIAVFLYCQANSSCIKLKILQKAHEIVIFFFFTIGKGREIYPALIGASLVFSTLHFHTPCPAEKA